jgi:protein TonB
MKQTICLVTLLTSFAISACGQKEIADQEKIIDPVEISASFPGGVDSLKSFIKKNLIQPKEKKTGIVFVAFIVSKDGTTSDFEVVRGLAKEHDARAIEVLKKMPKWTPGTQQGVIIRQRFIMPVKFE